MFDFRRLTSRSDIEEAKRLNYLSYIASAGWEPSAENPSGMRVADSPQGKLLVDNFTDNIEWFGTYDKSTLAACLRLFKPVDSRFEFELYHPCNDPMIDKVGGRELNRLAINEAYFQTNVFMFTILSIVEYCKLNGVTTLVTTARMPEPAELCRKIGMTPIGEPFKYESRDPWLCQIMSFDFRDSKKFQKLTNLLRQQLP